LVILHRELLIIFAILLAGLNIKRLFKEINIFFILSESFQEIMIWAISFQFFIVVHALVVLAYIQGIWTENILLLAKISTLLIFIGILNDVHSFFRVCREKFVLCFELLHWQVFNLFEIVVCIIHKFCNVSLIFTLFIFSEFQFTI